MDQDEKKAEHLTNEPEDSELDSRLEDLDAKLEHYRQADEKGLQARQDTAGGTSGLAMAWRLGSEFIAGVLVGGLIGYAIDKWFGVEPWGLIIFILLGFLAGMLNMLRSAGKISPPGG